MMELALALALVLIVSAALEVRRINQAIARLDRDAPIRVHPLVSRGPLHLIDKWGAAMARSYADPGPLGTTTVYR